MTLEEDVAAYLQDLELGTLGLNMFLGQLPATPNTAMSIMPNGGAVIIGDPVRHPSFQILVRDVNQKDVMVTARAVHQALHNTWGLLTEHKCRIKAVAEAGNVFLDPASLSMVSLNFDVDLVP